MHRIKPQAQLLDVADERHAASFAASARGRRAAVRTLRPQLAAAIEQHDA